MALMSHPSQERYGMSRLMMNASRNSQPVLVNEGMHMARWKTTLMTGLVLGMIATHAFAANSGGLLDSARELQESIAADAARSAHEAQAFGSTLSAKDRRELQNTCTALVRNERNARAQRQLQEFLSEYKDHDPNAVLRFCLDPAYRQLQTRLQTSMRSIERLNTFSAGDDELFPSDDSQLATVENRLQQENRMYTTISNIMKTRHDTSEQETR